MDAMPVLQELHVAAVQHPVAQRMSAVRVCSKLLCVRTAQRAQTTSRVSAVQVGNEFVLILAPELSIDCWTKFAGDGLIYVMNQVVVILERSLVNKEDIAVSAQKVTGTDVLHQCRSIVVESLAQLTLVVLVLCVTVVDICYIISGDVSATSNVAWRMSLPEMIAEAFLVLKMF